MSHVEIFMVDHLKYFQMSYFSFISRLDEVETEIKIKNHCVYKEMRGASELGRSGKVQDTF